MSIILVLNSVSFTSSIFIFPGAKGFLHDISDGDLRRSDGASDTETWRALSRQDVCVHRLGSLRSAAHAALDLHAGRVR